MIPVNIPQITAEDIEHVTSVLGAGWISGEGPVIKEFEEKVAESLGRRFGVAVSNGSDALDLAFRVLDLEPGDEVILPSFAIISCLAPILRFGLVPVFVDVDPVTWNLDVDQLGTALSEKTRAVLAVHTYGLPVDMDPLLAFADENKLWVIEDAAEAHGILYKDRLCGSMGHLSTFSFYANKNVTTGEGGMVLTNSIDLDERLRYFRNLTFRADRRFIHSDLGWNMRLSSLQAALGISQIKRVGQTVERRREIASAYFDRISGLEGIKLQASEAYGSRNGYWVVGVLLDNHKRFRSANEAMGALAEAGIGTRPFFYPLHNQPLLAKTYNYRKVGNLATSELLGEMGFYLPNGLGMPDDQLKTAVEATKSILG